MSGSLLAWILPGYFKMKEADGVVNSRDRYLLGALNSARSIVKGEQCNGMNTVSHMGYKTHSKF